MGKIKSPQQSVLAKLQTFKATNISRCTLIQFEYTFIYLFRYVMQKKTKHIFTYYIRLYKKPMVWITYVNVCFASGDLVYL